MNDGIPHSLEPTEPLGCTGADLIRHHAVYAVSCGQFKNIDGLVEVNVGRPCCAICEVEKVGFEEGALNSVLLLGSEENSVGSLRDAGIAHRYDLSYGVGGHGHAAEWTGGHAVAIVRRQHDEVVGIGMIGARQSPNAGHPDEEGSKSHWFQPRRLTVSEFSGRTRANARVRSAATRG